MARDADADLLRIPSVSPLPTAAHSMDEPTESSAEMTERRWDSLARRCIKAAGADWCLSCGGRGGKGIARRVNPVLVCKAKGLV